MKSKKLIISPHIDDDVLGCGGIMGEDTHVIYCGVEEGHMKERPSYDVRINEANKVCEYLGNTYKLLENKVNFYELQNLLQQFESIINDEKPDQIYIPYPSYNQDHRTIYDAVMTALRPHDTNFFVKQILVYEQPHVFLWDYTYNINNSFKPNYYIPIDIERKINAYKLMATQVRDFRSPETLMSMAQLRGSQSNCQFAEAFQILRWVE
jgi:N-acetylglucosamine malate deacetylase 1